MRIWTVGQPEPRLIKPSGGLFGVGAVALAPDSNRAASVDDGGAIRLWDLKSDREIDPLTGHVGAINATFSFDDSQIFTGGSDHTLRVWDAATRKEARQLANFPADVGQVMPTQDNRFLVITGNTASVQLRHLKTGRIQEFPTGFLGGSMAAVAPDGRSFVAANNQNSEFRLWNVETGKAVRQFTGHTNNLRSLACSPDGRHFLSASSDNTLRLWDRATGKELRRFAHNHFRSKQCPSVVAFSPDGIRVLVRCTDGALFLWDLSNPDAQPHEIEQHCSWHGPIAFAPDGKTFASAGDDGVLLWNANTGDKLHGIPSAAGRVSSVAYANDGRHVLTGNANGTAYVFRIPKSVFAELKRQRRVPL